MITEDLSQVAPTQINGVIETSRDRSKSAPAISKAQNSERTSNYSLLQHPKKIFEQVSQCRKNKRGTLCDFSTSSLSQNSKRIEERPFGGKKIFEKSRTMPKKPLVSPGIVRYADKNLFCSVPWANRYNLSLCRTSARTILVTSGVSKKNTDEKP